MFGFQVQSFLLAFLLFNTVHGSSSPSILSDSHYMTKAANNAFNKVLAAFPVSADPFNPGTIKLELPESKFELYNVLIKGLSACKVVETSFNEDESTFVLRALCPKLVLNSDFVGEGTMGGLACDGQGVTQIDSDYKLIEWKGSYEISTAEDGKKHIYATEYDIDVIYIEKMTYVINSMSDKSQSDVSQLNKYLSENWSEVTKYTEPTFIKVFIEKVFELYNNALKTEVTLDDIIDAGKN